MRAPRKRPFLHFAPFIVLFLEWRISQKRKAGLRFPPENVGEFPDTKYLFFPTVRAMILRPILTAIVGSAVCNTGDQPTPNPCDIQVEGKEPTTAQKATMKTETKIYRAKHALKDAPKVRTLDMRLSITNPDLGVEVRKAFDLAKSSGQELNLFFNGATC